MYEVGQRVKLVVNEGLDSPDQHQGKTGDIVSCDGDAYTVVLDDGAVVENLAYYHLDREYINPHTGEIIMESQLPTISQRYKDILVLNNCNEP